MATIYDVAKRAGVSPSTVSRVFNKTAPISQKTIERVLKAAQELEYDPNPLASGLASSRTLMVGLVISDIQNPFSATLARGVQDTLERERYITIIVNTDGDPVKELEVLREIYRRGVDGFIIAPPQRGDATAHNNYIINLMKEGLPVVTIGNWLKEAKVDYVTSRAQDGAAAAVDHLVELGHRDIAFIGGYYTRGVAVGRWLGYQEALLKHGVALQQAYMVETDVSTQGGQAAMERLLALPNRPSAVLTVNDLVALGAINSCRRHGIEVPRGISIVGFDDIPFAALSIPPLTTVAQPAYELGARAAELVLRRMREPTAPSVQAVLNCQLVIRQTTAPLHTGAAHQHPNDNDSCGDNDADPL
ncbi:MAG: LacI family DNA-binding transcriptional regulator [Caldilineaceae bacterium]|nr:LacI family DNA-binding transcriptional regulator [Caldilineaceae bacterium]